MTRNPSSTGPRRASRRGARNDLPGKRPDRSSLAGPPAPIVSGFAASPVGCQNVGECLTLALSDRRASPCRPDKIANTTVFAKSRSERSRTCPPTPSERLEHGNLVLNERRIGCGNGRIRRNQRLLGREQIEIAGGPRHHLIVSHVEYLVRPLLSFGQSLAAIQFGAIGRQRLLGLLERLKYDGIEARERCSSVGLCLPHARARCCVVGKGPCDARSHAPSYSLVRRQLVQLGADTPNQALERDLRIQIGGCDSDPGRRGCHTPVSLPHVGPALQQRRAIANGNEVAKPGRSHTRLHFGRSINGSAAQQGSQLEKRSPTLPLQWRDSGSHLRYQRLCPDDIEVRVCTGLF